MIAAFDACLAAGHHIAPFIGTFRKRCGRLLELERSSQLHSETIQRPRLSFANNRSRQKLLCCNAFVSVMKATKLRKCDNLSHLQHLSGKRTLFAEAQVGSRLVVVAEIKR